MTKSIIITYNEADESLLMSLFKRFKIKTKPLISGDNDEEGVPARVAKDIVEGLKLIKRHERGEIELPTLESLMEELKANEREAVHA